MHEWALAEAVVKTATEIAAREKLKEIEVVDIKIGELQQVERAILMFALKQLRPPSLKNTKFHITRAKTQLKCRPCGKTWVFQKQKLDQPTREAIHFVPEVAHTYIKCPQCGSPDFEIMQGRGIWIETVKGTR